MKQLDKNKPHGTVYGHSSAMYEQDGVLFDGSGAEIQSSTSSEVSDSKVIPHNGVENAKEFLLNILKLNPLSKAAVYKAAEQNSQQWDDVKNAAESIPVTKFQYQGAEMWKLPS